MKPKFNVTVESFRTIREIENSWSIADYRNILELLDYEDASEIEDKEVYDYLVLAMLDLEPEESATAVLKYKIGKRLNDNQIKQVAHDMVEEPLWEEYQDMSLHEDLFIVNALLYKAYNGKFPTPEAIILKINIEPLNHDGKILIENKVYEDESFICRVLASGMDRTSILNRLFEKQILGKKFPEAEHIIWTMKSTKEEDSVSISIMSSEGWVKNLNNSDAFESEAYSDRIKELAH